MESGENPERSGHRMGELNPQMPLSIEMGRRRKVMSLSRDTYLKSMVLIFSEEKYFTNYREFNTYIF